MSGAGQRAPRSLGSRAYAAVRWTITSAALLALLSGAAMFGPLTRKNRFMQPELAEQVAFPAAIAAVILFVLVGALPVPQMAVTNGAEVVTSITGAMALLLLGYRLWVGVDDDRGFSYGHLAPALPLLWLALLALSVLVFRLERIRRRDADARRWRGHRRRRN